jgi:crotonobetainyl-CoA:carnitine CoA-transferase CaiB-like acyl-CoA transferase
MNDAPRPLAGLKVLDFGHTVMGPCAGLLLADLGADVIKVEPVDGDTTRRMPGFASGFFATFSRNKRSLAVDLKRPEGQAVVHRLAAGADVVIENFGPGTFERLGCGYERLNALNPRLIYLALKGYLAGPYEHRGALDEIVQMQSGLAYMTGPPGQPLRAGAPIIDILGAVFGVVGVLAALRERDRTGKGQRVGSALFESAAFLMSPWIAGSAAIKEPMPPMPARKGAWGIYDNFTTADGVAVFIGVTSDGHWTRFCQQFDLAHLGDHPALQSNADRAHARDWLLPQVRDVIGALPVAQVLERAEAAGLPFARVNRPDEILEESQLQAHGGLIETVLSALGGEGVRTLLPGLPLEFGPERNRTELRAQPPRIGEHTIETLGEAGFAAEEIKTLLADKVIKAA